MMEGRVFVIVAAVEGGVDVTLTTLQPEPATAATAIILRSRGQLPNGEATVLHIPGATVSAPE